MLQVGFFEFYKALWKRQTQFATVHFYIPVQCFSAQTQTHSYKHPLTGAFSLCPYLTQEGKEW